MSAFQENTTFVRALCPTNQKNLLYTPRFGGLKADLPSTRPSDPERRSLSQRTATTAPGGFRLRRPRFTLQTFAGHTRGGRAGVWSNNVYYIYIYIHLCMYVCMCTYIYIYVYTHTYTYT